MAKKLTKSGSSPWRLTSDEKTIIRDMPRRALEELCIAQKESINKFLRGVKHLGNAINVLQMQGSNEHE